jgi:hypothetical protein
MPLESLEMTILPIELQRPISFYPKLCFFVILAPKISKSFALSIFALIHNNCVLHYIYLVIVCFTLGNPTLEPLFKDFQEQVIEDTEDFFSGQQGKCL